MEYKSDFSKGLNSDITPVKQPPGSYVEAVNYEIISDELQGSLSISNSQGNKFQVTLPNVGKISKITIKNFSSSSFITINGEVPLVPFVTTESSTGADLYNFIKLNYTQYGVQYEVYYDSYFCVIVPIYLPDVITVTTSDSSVLEVTLKADTSTNIKPIGYAVIRGDLFILGTPCIKYKPKIGDGGYGYWFKINYDNITYNPSILSLKLIYAGDMSLSQYYPVFQTGVVPRYENNNIQRIYFTDNYNKTRVINVVDPQLFALDVDLLDMVPSVDFDVPLLTNIGSAPGTEEVHPGCWQLSYRLKKNNGQVTAFSPLSDMVWITLSSEQLVSAPNNPNNWIEYFGRQQGVGFTKQVSWTVDNIDVDFDRIEFCLARRSSKEDPGTFYLVEEVVIGSNDSISVTVNGTKISTAETLTLEEFLTLTSVFTHCKTMGTKDNRLVVGNVRNEIGKINYDARAYRWKSDNTFSLINGGNLTTGLTDPILIEKTNDAICPLNLDVYGGGDYDSDSKYQADGVTLGGEGTNVKYDFVGVVLGADIQGTPIDNPSGVYCGVPYVHTTADGIGQFISLGVDSINKEGNDALQEHTKVFSNQEIFSGIKFPPFSTLLTGYQNNEIYRMGIQFYDKSKQPYFVEWIGDIKFPDVSDVYGGSDHHLYFTDGSPTGASAYPKILDFNGGSENNVFYTVQLGIRFTINIPAELTNQVSGYSIVRVKREEKDKNIKAEGLLRPMTYVDGITNIGYYKEPGEYGTPHYLNNGRYMFYSPNILDSSLKGPEAGDIIVSLYTSDRVARNLSLAGPDQCANFTDDTFIAYFEKFYNKMVDTSRLYVPIEYSTLVSTSGEFSDGGTDSLYNQSAANDNGNTSYYLKVGDGDALGRTERLVQIYNYKAEQYGGNTYLQRSKSIYQSCSHFRPINTRSYDTTDTFFCYGGDVTTGIMDDTILAGNTSSSEHYSTTIVSFYAATSPVNRELRSANHPNRNAISQVGLDWNYKDEYEYNTAYSCEDNIIQFFPEPDFYVDNDIFDNRFYISEIKINGEFEDSWDKFKSNNYWDVEGDKGPINSMIALKDKMYFWQDRAFGIIEINPRAVVTDVNNPNNAELQLGTGLPLQRHDYITVTSGSKHQGSTIASYGKLYWYDVNTSKLWRYSPGDSLFPLSDIKGLYSYLSKYLNGDIQNYDKPLVALSDVDGAGLTGGVNGVTAVYDSKHQKVLFTFHSSIGTTQTSFTVALNELTDFFTTFYSFIPRMYLTDSKNVFSFNNNNSNKTKLKDLYVHNKGDYNNFYGTLYDSYLKFIVNENPEVTKVFDNFVWDSQATKYVASTNSYQNYNDITFTAIRVTDDYQNTGKQDLVVDTNVKRKERSWQMAVPRNRVLYTSSDSPNIYTDISSTNKPFGERIRDKYIQIELWFTNTASNYQLKLNNFITQVRESNR